MHVSVPLHRLLRAGYESGVDGLRGMGLERVELALTTDCELPSLTDPDADPVYVGNEEGARAYRAALFAVDVRASSLTIDWSVSEEPGLQWAAQALRAAGIIGARGIVLKWPVLDDLSPSGASHTLGEMLQRTHGSRSSLSLRHERCPLDIPRVHRLLEQLDPDRVGVSLAPARLVASGGATAGIYDTVRALAPWVRHVACEPLTGCDLASGSVDYAEIACILGAAGYAGALVAMSPWTDAAQLRRDVSYLKDIIGQH